MDENKTQQEDVKLEIGQAAGGEKTNPAEILENIEISKVPPPDEFPSVDSLPMSVQSIDSLLAIVAQKGGDVATIDKLLEVKMKYEADEARKAFVRAMVAFKADPPKIFKDNTVAYKQVKYSHATLGNVVEKIGESLAKHGLAHTFRNGRLDSGNHVVTCIITHILGHSEETTLDAGADTSGSKNDIQAIGSVVTYLQRYTLLSATGLATYNQDDDGRGSENSQIEPEYLTEDHLRTVESTIEELGDRMSLNKFMAFKKVSELKYLFEKDYESIVEDLDKRRRGEK